MKKKNVWQWGKRGPTPPPRSHVPMLKIQRESNVLEFICVKEKLHGHCTINGNVTVAVIRMEPNRPLFVQDFRSKMEERKKKCETEQKCVIHSVQYGTIWGQMVFEQLYKYEIIQNDYCWIILVLYLSDKCTKTKTKIIKNEMEKNKNRVKIVKNTRNLLIRMRGRKKTTNNYYEKLRTHLVMVIGGIRYWKTIFGN